MVVAACSIMAWPIVDSWLRTVPAATASLASAAPTPKSAVAQKRKLEVETASAHETSASAATDTTGLAAPQHTLEPTEQARVPLEPASAEHEQDAASAQREREHERNAALELERTREQELRVARRHERVKREAQALDLARRSVDITMYSTRWCAACARARAYMQVENIAFTELDVEADKSARARQRALNPRGSVPTIEVDDQVLIGFSVAALEKRIEHAARQRRGVR